MKIAPSVRFRQLVENALTHLCWFDTVRGQLGLTGLSQIWDEEPAWYFWLGGRSYLLRYANLTEESTSTLTAILHVFPTREEWASERPSSCMHPLLTDEQFDFATMTPRFESYALFKDAFIAGELTICLSNGKLRLLTVSGYDQEWEAVWAFTEFFVAMLTFQRKAGPADAPYHFCPQDGIGTVLVPFDSPGSSMAKVIVAADPCRRLPTPLAWHHLAHEQFRCSATGTCACSHER